MSTRGLGDKPCPLCVFIAILASMLLMLVSTPRWFTRETGSARMDSGGEAMDGEYGVLIVVDAVRMEIPPFAENSISAL